MPVCTSSSFRTRRFLCFIHCLHPPAAFAYSALRSRTQFVQSPSTSLYWASTNTTQNLAITGWSSLAVCFVSPLPIKNVLASFILSGSLWGILVAVINSSPLKLYQALPRINFLSTSKCLSVVASVPASCCQHCTTYSAAAVLAVLATFADSCSCLQFLLGCLCLELFTLTQTIVCACSKVCNVPSLSHLN